MVRKRGFHEETDDSDSDYDPVSNDSEPKRYSLRKRTRQSLIEDFDYEVDSDLSSRHPTDDEEYTLDEANGSSYISCVQPAINHVQRLPTTSQVDNGLIDFEDIIRADIVMNKNNINLDTGLDKSVDKTVKKRGRPPKYKPEFEDFGHSILGPFADIYAAVDDPADLVETSVQVHETDTCNTFIESVPDPVRNTYMADSVLEKPIGIENNSPNTTSVVESQIESLECNELKETSSSLHESTGQVSTEIESVTDTNKTQSITNNKIENHILSATKSPETEKGGENVESEIIAVEEEEDDVIIIQNNTEIVVLDD